MNLKVHSNDRVINYEAQFGEWKIQLTMRVISFKYSEETRTMHTHCDNVEFMKGSETISPKNNDNNCFQYALTTALNWEKIGRDNQRI